jgi:hypothetical protein
VEASLFLEPPDPRLEFSFLTVLSWWILDHIRKVFNELSMRL